MVAPSFLTGKAWTCPQSDVANRLSNLGRPNPFGDLGKRWPKIGLGRGLEGLTKPSVNCVPVAVPDGAQFGEHVFANQAGSRAYKLYVPSGYNEQPLPLVVMLHGCNRVDAAGVSCYSSKDLMNWKLEGVALAPNTKDSTSDIIPVK